jgi:hypothetical protein
VFAFADQYAVNVPQGTLPPSTRHQIAEIRHEATQDVNANITFADLDTKLHALATELHTAVDNGLQQDRVHEFHRHSSEHEKQFGQHA